MDDVFGLFGKVLNKIGKIIDAGHPVSVDPRVALLHNIASTVFQTLEDEYGDKAVAWNEENN